MKHYVDRVIPETIGTYLEKTTCDLCGNDVDDGIGLWEVDEVRMKYRHGRQYPEASWGEEEEFDICGRCWTEKLVPWMAEQGAKPLVKEYDY